jgi:hypothetical protein
VKASKGYGGSMTAKKFRSLALRLPEAWRNTAPKLLVQQFDEDASDGRAGIW